jgi:APA family basic amino acid/polyamine antiporter
LSALRGIGVGSAAALVAGNMIGAGVFTTSGFALADLGSRGAVLLAWVVGGGIALCGALSYAALAARIPGNGGEYLFLSRAVNPLLGFLAGWVSLLAGFTAPIAVAAHGLEAYAGASLGVAMPAGVLGAGAILLAGLAHGISRGPGLQLQNWAVGIKLAAIVAFVGAGAAALLGWGGSPDAAWAARGALEELAAQTEARVSLSAFAVTLVWVSFAYSGWNAAVYIAGELDAPERTLPRALAVATLGVTALYVALNAVFVYAAPIEALAGRPEVGAIAAEALGGAWARAALSGIVALGLLTSISAMVMVGPRVYAQMAQDGVLPDWLAAASDAPRTAVWMQVGLALAAFFVGGLRDLLLYVGFLLSLSAAATVACLFGEFVAGDGDGARAPGHPWVPGLFIVVTLASAGFMLFREPMQALAGLGTLGLGAAVYALSRHRSPSPGRPDSAGTGPP